MWPAGRQHLYELEAWQQAEAFSALLHDVCGALDLGHDKEWLVYLLRQAGQLIGATVAEGWHREHLAECLLGLSEALTLVALIDYYLVFLCHEGYLVGQRADEVTGKLNALQGALTALTDRVREALRARPEGRLPFTPWSQN
jgi:hypothetical protein